MQMFYKGKIMCYPSREQCLISYSDVQTYCSSAMKRAMLQHSRCRHVFLKIKRHLQDMWRNIFYNFSSLWQRFSYCLASMNTFAGTSPQRHFYMIKNTHTKTHCCRDQHQNLLMLLKGPDTSNSHHRTGCDEGRLLRRLTSPASQTRSWTWARHKDFSWRAHTFCPLMTLDLMVWRYISTCSRTL